MVPPLSLIEKSFDDKKVDIGNLTNRGTTPPVARPEQVLILEHQHT